MNTDQTWIIEAHDLGALQVRSLRDALVLNRKKWLAGEKADRLLVGSGATIEAALETERELKRMKKPGEGEGKRTKGTEGTEGIVNAPAQHEP